MNTVKIVERTVIRARTRRQFRVWRSIAAYRAYVARVSSCISLSGKVEVAKVDWKNQRSVVGVDAVENGNGRPGKCWGTIVGTALVSTCRSGTRLE